MKYRQVTEDFLAHLGNRATAPLTAITPGDIASFRDGLRASGCSAKTANLARSIISAAFLAALKQGHLAHNPAQAVDSLRIRKTEGREAFTHEELARIVAVAEGDWRGLILCASTTGLEVDGCRDLDVAGYRFGAWAAYDPNSKDRYRDYNAPPRGFRAVARRPAARDWLGSCFPQPREHRHGWKQRLVDAVP